MLLQSPFPPDIRVEREINSLFENGFKIGILCNQYIKNNSPKFPNCEIFRINALFSNTILNKILNFPLFINPRFVIKIFQIYWKFKPDFIHAHDLPMVPLALLIKKFFKKPVVFDVHESYPEALIFFKKKGFVNFLFKNPKLAKILEKYCLKKSDILIVVVEEHKQKLIDQNVSENKIFVVSNTVDLKTFCIQNPKTSIKEKYYDKFIFLYTGIVSNERGLEVPIKAIPIIKKVLHNVLFMIVGEGPAKNDLIKFVNILNINDNVEFFSWPGHSKIADYMYSANVCIIPQPSNDFINSGVPNKLFEYMSQGKTVLVSDAKPMSRIILETNSGKVFKSNDEYDFAKKLIEISNKNFDYGKNGRKAVEEKYNWNNDANVLINLYYSLIN